MKKRVARMSLLLQGTAAHIARHESRVPKALIFNTNRFRMREQGPHIVFSRLGATRKPQGRENQVYFVEGQEEAGGEACWAIVQHRRQKRKLKQFLEACDAVVAAVGDAPRTLTEYATKMRDAREALTKRQLGFRPPLLNGSYLGVWFLRAHIIGLMYKSRIQKLTIDGDITMSAFLSMNPDQKQHLQSLYMHVLKKFGLSKRASVQELLSHFPKCPAHLPIVNGGVLGG